MDAGEQAEESSSNRRERLLALRSAAAAAASSPASTQSAATPSLPPPAAWDLPEPDLTPSSAPRPPARFGFYTNPGAAFSSAAAPHKRKSPDSRLGPSPAPALLHGNYGNNYPPHQHHMAPFPMEPAPPGTIPYRSPMQFQTPISEYRGAPPGPPPHWNPHSASPAQDSYPRSPNFGFRGSNVGRGGSPMNYGPRGSPMNYGPRGSPMNYGPRGSPMNYGPRGSLMNYGPRGSPCSSSGQGRGENYYSSPGSRGRWGRGGSSFQNHSGRQDHRTNYKSMVDDPWQNLQPIVGSILIPIGGGGAKSWLPESLCTEKDTPDHCVQRRGGRGGSGFQNHSGGQEQRDYSKKSMVDDPWKNLQPIVGSILIPIGGGGESWLPESLRTKKDTPDQGRTVSTSGLSLAEYLDLSFNEVSNET